VLVGTAPNCAIRLADDPMVSPTHAAIYYDPHKGRIRLKDMDSRHGTTRNGRKITGETVIRAGDRITFGQLSTLQGSSWNALQKTRLTRLSRLITRRIAKISTSKATSRHKSASFAVACVLLAAAAFWCLKPHGWPGRSPVAAARDARHGPQTRLRARLRLRARTPKGTTQTASVLDNRGDKSALTDNQRFIWDEIMVISQHFGDPPPSAMDLGFVKKVERNIREYTAGGRHLPLLARKRHIWPLITHILREKGLPIDLGYVVWVESAFDPQARSPAGAAGLWQLMQETAREYGLVVNGDHDERLDPVKSTIAAATYMTDLRRTFKSQRYLLVLASYNSGQTRVRRSQLAAAINGAGHGDFWQIRQKLPQETIEYVPRVMAAMIIGRNPDRWSLAH